MASNNKDDESANLFRRISQSLDQLIWLACDEVASSCVYEHVLYHSSYYIVSRRGMEWNGLKISLHFYYPQLFSRFIISDWVRWWLAIGWIDGELKAFSANRGTQKITKGDTDPQEIKITLFECQFIIRQLITVGGVNY